MVFFQCVSGINGGRRFSLGLLMLIALCLPLAIGQQVGVSLKLRGVTIPNNSLVDIDDILYRAPIDGYRENATNTRPDLHDQALLCVTDLEDCCAAPRTVRGNWYYPNGNRVPTAMSEGRVSFQRNRGPNEVINGRQFYGSVRLWRRYSNPPEKGRFRCDLPSAVDSSVNQTLYVNIVNFGITYYISPVTLSPSGPGIVGNSFALMCSATLISPIPLPSNVPSPTFEWFFGTEANSPLPSGVIPTKTTVAVNSSYNIYTSVLFFSPALNESHAGMYTCKLGEGQLANSTLVSVNVAAAQIIPNELPVSGQSTYRLTCKVFVTGNLCPTSITYRWTKDSSTAIQLDSQFDTLSFPLLRLSDARVYTCYATISSTSLSSDITVMASHEVRIQIPAVTSVILSAISPTPTHPNGSLTCIVRAELSSEVDTPVTVNTVLTDPAGFKAMNTLQPAIGDIMTYTTTAIISSLDRNQSGDYNCTATLDPLLNNTYIISSTTKWDSVQVIMGVHLALRNQFIANGSQINIRSIGQSSDNPNSALQCITDLTESCCGQWYMYLPNGARVQVGNNSPTTAFYRSSGNNGEVFLNRPSEVTSPTGQFCCATTNAAYRYQTLCVTIDVVSISPIGFPTVGENYTLECSANGSMVTFEWLGQPDGSTSVVNTSSITINSNSITSQLRFRPLQQSHSGPYTCHATWNGSSHLSRPIRIDAIAPRLSIKITESTSGANPTAGQNYEVICSILGAENLNSTITYQWINNNLLINDSNSLSFTPARISDAGTNYSCSATISSSYLTGDIATVMSHRVKIQIPTPSSITLISSELEVNFIGSSILFTCTVELNPAIRGSEIFRLTINAHLYKGGALLALDGPIVTGTTFTYTKQLNSIQRNDFGYYTCTAIISPQSSATYITGIDVLSDTISIKAVLPPPVDVRATQSSPSSPVEVSWSPPTDQGAFNITGYRIFYGCSGENVSMPAAATSIGLRVEGGYEHQRVSLRSESDDLYSELVNVTVDYDMAKYPCGCSREIGATIGVMICLVTVATIIVITVLHWWRKKLSTKKEAALDLAINMAYKEVTCKAEAERENELYESVGDCDITLSQQQPFKETTAASTIREVSASKCTDTGH